MLFQHLPIKLLMCRPKREQFYNYHSINLTLSGSCRIMEIMYMLSSRPCLNSGVLKVTNSLWTTSVSNNASTSAWQNVSRACLDLFSLFIWNYISPKSYDFHSITVSYNTIHSRCFAVCHDQLQCRENVGSWKIVCVESLGFSLGPQLFSRTESRQCRFENRS